MKVSFLILTWNRYKFLEICLERLIGSIASIEDCEIVVMDNGCTDQTSQVLARYLDHPHVRIVKRPSHEGLEAYKKLFAEARGELMVTVDDDVLDFPCGVDRIFQDYMRTYTDYGYLALNVIQDEFTNGAKPRPECYTEDTRGDKVVQLGPAGGWCACFRRGDYRKIRFTLLWTKFDMRHSEDGIIIARMRRYLRLKAGIVRDAVCFHACGPYYAKVYGHLDREIAKYSAVGLTDFVAHFSTYLPGDAAEAGNVEDVIQR